MCASVSLCRLHGETGRAPDAPRLLQEVFGSFREGFDTPDLREARALLGIPGVTGVNISGAASARGYEFAAQVKAELAVRIREERDHDP